MSILQNLLENCIRDIDQVLSYLGITGEEAETLRKVAQRRQKHSGKLRRDILSVFPRII